MAICPLCMEWDNQTFDELPDMSFCGCSIEKADRLLNEKRNLNLNQKVENLEKENQLLKKRIERLENKEKNIKSKMASI